MKHVVDSDYPDNNHNSESGFSGKLKSMGSVGKMKKRNNKEEDEGEEDLSSSYSYSTDFDGFEKKRTPHIFDSGELNFSISRELKPSTPARSVCITKVISLFSL